MDTYNEAPQPSLTLPPALVEKAEDKGYQLTLGSCADCPGEYVYVRTLHGMDKDEAARWVEQAPDFPAGF